MRNLPKKKVFNILDSILLNKNYTISKSIINTDNLNIILFSMAENTNISKEYYNHESIFYVLQGSIEILDNKLKENYLYISPKKSLRGVRAFKDTVYLEIEIKGDKNMQNIEKGKLIDLKNKIEYVDGGISNLDIISKENIKLMLMAFDKGEGLSDHAAPGDAMVMALEGRADLKVGNEIHEIKEGQQLIFPKGEIHNIFAKEKFKMALLLILD